MRENAFSARLTACFSFAFLAIKIASFTTVRAVRITPHTLLKGYRLSTMFSKPKKLKGYAITRHKKTIAYLCFSSENAASFLERDIAFRARSLTIFRDDTSVVKIAAAINTPQIGFRCNCSEIAKTGIKLSFVSDKTIV